MKGQGVYSLDNVLWFLDLIEATEFVDRSEHNFILLHGVHFGKPVHNEEIEPIIDLEIPSCHPAKGLGEDHIEEFFVVESEFCYRVSHHEEV